MQLKFFFLATVISIATTLYMANVSTAQPNLSFDKLKDIQDRVEDRKDVGDHVKARKAIRNRIDDRKDTREKHFNNFPSKNRDSSNFFPNRFP